MKEKRLYTLAEEIHRLLNIHIVVEKDEDATIPEEEVAGATEALSLVTWSLAVQWSLANHTKVFNVFYARSIGMLNLVLVQIQRKPTL